MKAFFDSLNDVAALEALISGGIRETSTLEYKRAAGRFTDSEKNELAKDVSAFANSGGGLLIYGIATAPGDKTLPTAVEGLEVTNIETFDRVVNSRITPPVKGILTKLLPNTAPQALAVLVPHSPDRPHQADYRYYRRAGTESKPMEHDLVATMFGRREGPVLNLRIAPLEAASLPDPAVEWSTPARVRVFVVNDGLQVARFSLLVLLFPDANVCQVEVTSGNATSITALQSGTQAFQWADNIGVIHSSSSVRVLELAVRFHRSAADALDQHHLRWQLLADGMLRRDGSTTLSALNLMVAPATEAGA